jgi:uncharacterized C2H2 Zn-finger protein
MVKYCCGQCNKNFLLKGDYVRHINKKKPCKMHPVITLKDNKNDIAAGLSCKYCMIVRTKI